MLANNFTKLFVRTSVLSRNTPIISKYSVMSDKVKDIVKIQSTDDFKEKVINSKVPVIVDFFATWCNPCKLLTPRLEAIIAENKGKVVLAKVDIDEQTDLALDYEVSSVPVLIAIKNGKVQERLVGLQDADKLRKWVRNFTSDVSKVEAKA